MYWFIYIYICVCPVWTYLLGMVSHVLWPRGTWMLWVTKSAQVSLGLCASGLGTWKSGILGIFVETWHIRSPVDFFRKRTCLKWVCLLKILSKSNGYRWWFHFFGNFHPKNWGRWTHFDDHVFFRWVGSTTNQLVLQREKSLQIVVDLESQGWTICITSRSFCWRFFVWHWKGWKIENHVEKWVEINP